MTDRYAGCTYPGIFLWGDSVLLKQFSPSSPHACTSQRCIGGYEWNFFQLRLHQHDWALLFPDTATAFTHHSCRGLFSQQGEPNAFPLSSALPKAASTGSRKQFPTCEMGTTAPASWSVLRAAFSWDHASEAAAMIYIAYACTYTDACICMAKDECCTCPWVGKAPSNMGAKWLYPVMLRSPNFWWVLRCCTCPLFPPSNSPCLPGRPICFMCSKYWIRARVAVLFPHQYGIAGHSSQCFATSMSSSYETMAWWPHCHMVRSVGTT